MQGMHGVLVAGVGNVFVGDDGFGPEVARALLRSPSPQGVRVVDYGIGGIHLAYDLLHGYDLLVLVDTVSRGEPPGTVFVMELDPDTAGDGLDAHSMDPARMFASLRILGGTPPPTILVGCEPGDVIAGIGLSPAVAGAVEVAVSAVYELLVSTTSAAGRDA